MPVIDQNLHDAAVSGDVAFLRRAIASKIPHNEDYFLGLHQYWKSNIFNIAASSGQVKFVEEAIDKLPKPLVLRLLSDQQHIYGWNPLHDAVNFGHIEILKLMLGFYKSYSGPLLEPDDINHPRNKPWLQLLNKMEESNMTKQLPLHLCIVRNREDLAMEIMETREMDMEFLCNILDGDGNSLLFLAVQKGFNRVAEKILNSDCSYSLSNKDGSTALHIASRCSERVTKLLFKKHKDCLKTIDSKGFSVLRQWAEVGSLAQLVTLLDEEGLTDYYLQQERERASQPLDGFKPPWFPRYECGNTRLHVALSLNLEDHALYFLSVDSTLCEVKNGKGESPLFAAVQNGCDQVVKEILRIHPDPNHSMLRRNDGQTLLHQLQFCSEETGSRLLGKFWWMITIKDNGGRTALDEAKIVDLRWLVNLLTNPSLIRKEPFNWITVCEQQETWAIMAFIETCNDLEEVFRKENDTPLHHIKLGSCQAYRDFLKNPSFKELKNTTDREGATPLHRALLRKDIQLAKALLVDTEVLRNIVDHTGNTALSLLFDLCKDDNEWGKMCQEIKVNPYLKTTYVQARTDLDQMRNTLSIVAALLATITFAAAFTLPGGVNSTNGYGMLAKKAPFLVFLLADAYALCTSILVLFCLIWSMVSDRDMSYFLVDRSVFILMQSLYGTLLAFMTGIYAVIAHDSLWAALIVLVLSSLLGISVNRTVLRQIITKLFPAISQLVTAVLVRLLPASKKDDELIEVKFGSE